MTAALRTPLKHLMLLIVIIWLSPVRSWIVPQLRENIWVTLAKSLKQDNFCMAMGSVDNPLSTCLVGVPLSPNDYPYAGKKPNPVDTWDEWTRILPHAPQEPQELNLLGSSQATYCVRFRYQPSQKDWDQMAKLHPAGAQEVKRHDVSPHDQRYHAANWCNYTSTIVSRSSSVPRVLPRGVFLICSDRVWAGIPSQIQGGPCSLGQLTTLTPNKTQILNWKNENKLARKKRSYNQFDENCDSKIYNWGKTKRVTVSIFLPWYAAAKALGELSHLECWLSKQANATSAALSDLLADEEVTRHATLQNRAAIDFLLLAHGHGCEDFEGMCCFNLASKSTSIQANIQRIREQVDNIKTETSTVDPVNKLLSQWGVPGWVAIILKGLFWIFLIMFIISVALFLFRRMLLKTLGSAYLINKNGGDVGGGVGEGSLGLPWETAVV
ncbi:uncharacterized protein LOC128806783 [Vidua macroura]|uniref:uncharacterized protein LOC128806783 n=1 Tax=Vidua macroura TaxID=187451 RepID=UPI0023A7F575|nr:uncharacterized protein LOC128806783 [Vidua macroura]